MLCIDPLWRSAISQAVDQGEFSVLDFVVFTTTDDERVSGLLRSFSIDDYEPLCLRALCYHGIHTRDFTLFTYLIEAGAYMGKISYDEYRRQALRFLPSLLSIAAERNDRQLVEFLLSHGVDAHDSQALCMVVKSACDSELITALMDASEAAHPLNRGNYGSRALRKAIRIRELGLVELLAKRTDVNSFEDNSDNVYRRDSPLGVAIRRNRGRDIDIVQCLLKNGGKPNAIVTYNGFQSEDDNEWKYVNGWEDMIENIERTFLLRMTAMLAAINTGHLPMVQLLVQEGADVNLAPRFGVTRTPLQRAAENGDFAIVEYLLEQGARIDAEPALAGGTALQLASIEEYIGIATLLLEKGADVNLPAAGSKFGRTAFEGAAERGRVDMMILLMKWGADLRADDDRQYKRACDFAEKNGQMATKRFVKYLYEKSGAGDDFKHYDTSSWGVNGLDMTWM